MPPPDEVPRAYPPLRTTPTPGKSSRRVVGFDTSPSSVLRPASGSESPASARHDALESPSGLAALLKKERSLPQLALPKLKLGGGGSKTGKGMPRSKSHGNLARQSQPAEVAAPIPARSATSSPHAASSGGSEPVRIPFELTRRRTASVDMGAGAATDDELASTPIISAASSLLGHHLGAGSTTGSPYVGAGSAAAAIQRSQLVAKDLFVAQADAVMAHAQVQSLQSALRKEQDEVVRLRVQLELMTAERDRLLTDLQQGGEVGGASLFDMDQPSPGGGGNPGLQQPQKRPNSGSGLRTKLRLR